MKILFDTNILISAFLTSGISHDVIEDAILNKIDVIISGDKDLLDIKFYKGIKIISPKRYWNLYQ